jgi:hypothetical protein
MEKSQLDINIVAESSTWYDPYYDEVRHDNQIERRSTCKSPPAPSTPTR